MNSIFSRKIRQGVPTVFVLSLLLLGLVFGQKMEIKAKDGEVHIWPHKQSRIIAYVNSGDEVLIKARIGEWFRVHLLPDERGRIKSGFIHKSVLSNQKNTKLEELGSFAIELKQKNESGFSGEVVSLKFKDADIRDVIICLCSLGRMNVVFDPDVSGKITLNLKEVPWDQALDVVLKTFRLGKEIQGNVLRTAKRDTLLKKQGPTSSIL